MSEGFDVVGPQRHDYQPPDVAGFDLPLPCRACGKERKDDIHLAYATGGVIATPSSSPRADKAMAVEFRFTMAMVGQERDALKARDKVERALRTVLHDPRLAVSATISIRDADGG